VLKRTSAASLQAATGAPAVDVGEGRTSVTFAPTPASGTSEHAAVEQPPGPAFGSALPPKPLGGSGATIARATSTPGGGSDDRYEAFLDRLKRDLLREREQYGDLLGDLSW
jgi:hypothetical protein